MIIGACYRHGRIMLHDGYCADCRVEKLSEEQEIAQRGRVYTLEQINKKMANYETNNETPQSQKKSQKRVVNRSRRAAGLK